MKRNWIILILWMLQALGIQGASAADSETESSVGLWERLSPSFSLRGAYWSRDRSYTSRRDYVASSAWLTLRPEEVFGSKIYFEGYLGANDSLRGSSLLAEIREAYLERSLGPVDLKVGRQINIWGRADKINPTDQWTSKNLTLLATDDEDQRLGALALQATYHWNDFRFIGLFQPEWRTPRYPIPPISGVQLVDLRPVAPHQQFGLKLDQTGGTVDWSLSYSRVISRIPQLSVLSAGAAGTTIGLQYGYVGVVGGDFALNWGEYGIRGEVGYTDSSDETGRDPLRFNSEIFAVLGADRTLIENFNLNAQILYKHTLNYQDPGQIQDSNVRTLAIQQNLIANQLGTHRWGASLRPSYKMLHDTLEFEVAYVQWFFESGGLLRPKVTYAIHDQLKAIVGAEEYFGVQGSFFGRLADVSSVFAELRLSF